MQHQTPNTPDALTHHILTSPQIFIKQKKSWLEIFTSFEKQSKYHVLGNSGEILGSIVELGSGFIKLLTRTFLRTHRPFAIEVRSPEQKSVLRFHRKFFWFFSDIFVTTPDGVALGSAHRKFAILSKRYTMHDANGQIFARIYSPFWRIWTFNILDLQDREVAFIRKKWGGLIREGFTEADTFQIDFGLGHWNAHQRAVLFATAITIDFDFFERARSGNILSNIFQGL